MIRAQTPTYYRLSINHRHSNLPLLERWAVRIIIITTALNLNGVVNMAFDIGQAMSILMLIASLILVIRIGKAARSSYMSFFIATIVTYIALGAFFTSTYDFLGRVALYGQTYASTLLITWAVAASYVSAMQNGRGIEFICLARNAFVVTAAAVWASPLLYKFYVNAPPSMADRMSGFFGNPNEAGAAAAAALALVMGNPYRSKLLTLATIVISVGAIVLTFSKTAMLIAIAIITLGAWNRFRGPARILTVFGALLVVQAVQKPHEIVDIISKQAFIELSAEQQRRLLQMGEFLAGDLTLDTTTGRTDMWQIGVDRIMTSLPLGQGLGSYHFLEGGYFENGILQGVHNTFLMLWGEGGLLVGLLFIAFCALIAKGLINYRGLGVATNLSLIVFSVLMTGHNSLALRFINLIIGFVIGALIIAKGQAVIRGNARGHRYPNGGRIPSLH